ncbi:NADPH-dependent oxidoreductase [Chelatococcus asaccharovorans]|uniref:Nitroreductase n=1 Tax=Chelatococcus asaccharovorans TaxID=28210 RepID=A0A2V3U5F7_9HYPH|nr:NADPH-dependent oxidoreductase [Chelatococcus asaccharovorans]MBS7703787.1 NADPH-dependent oxidoreductase [Chelatococcus asaccharovorans]PXW57947.1 nitroreductase [Chelatococcus asaccharovorans]
MTTHVPPPAVQSPAAAFAARYRATTIPPVDLWSPVLDRVFAHATVRNYLPDPLPDGTLEVLVGAAQSAASSSNLQLWSVIAVEDPARRARLAALAGNQQHIAVAPLILLFVADLSRAARVATRHGRPQEGLDYLDTFLVGALDAALAAQNAVLAAESLGLGTVYIGALRNRITEVAAELKLPSHVAPVFGLVVGRPDPQKPAGIKPRLPQSAVLHRETYGADGEAEAIAAYDEQFHAFQNEQGLPRQDWSSVLAARIASAAFLNGRERLADALRAFGFALK